MTPKNNLAHSCCCYSLDLPVKKWHPLKASIPFHEVAQTNFVTPLDPKNLISDSFLRFQEWKWRIPLAQTTTICQLMRCVIFPPPLPEMHTTMCLEMTFGLLALLSCLDNLRGGSLSVQICTENFVKMATVLGKLGAQVSIRLSNPAL